MAKVYDPVEDARMLLASRRDYREDDDLYFIMNLDTGAIKIGISADPLARKEDLEMTSGSTLRVLRIVDSGARFERPLHKHFAKYRMRGEWFRSNPQLLRLAYGMESVRQVLTEESYG